MGSLRLGQVLFSLCWLISLVGCGSSLDTSWHIEMSKLHETSSAKEQISPVENSWRFVEEAQYGDTLPDGRKAGYHDVLWEWRMELENISDSPFEIKVKYFLVTADKELAA